MHITYTNQYIKPRLLNCTLRVSLIFISFAYIWKQDFKMVLSKREVWAKVFSHTCLLWVTGVHFQLYLLLPISAISSLKMARYERDLITRGCCSRIGEQNCMLVFLLTFTFLLGFVHLLREKRVEGPYKHHQINLEKKTFLQYIF